MKCQMTHYVLGCPLSSYSRILRCSLKRHLPRKYSTSWKESVSSLRKSAADIYAKRVQLASEQIEKANKKYENFVGLSDVKEAQRTVKEAEAIFLEARAKERTIMREMISTRENLKHVRERLSHVDYSNPMYLQLASEQHELVTQEDKQKTELEAAEDHERDSFSSLSNAMRESYEHERARVEKTKNWSIIGTMVGTIIGMMGSIYMNRVRTKNLINTIQESADKSEISSKLEMLESKTEEKHTAISTTIESLAEHMAAMNTALQVQNMEALSGFVNDTFTGNKALSSPQSSPNRQTETATNAATLQILSEEIEQYNKALLSLSNAVLALSNAEPTSSIENSKNVQDQLDELLKNSTTTNSKLNDIILSANKINVGEIASRLRTLEDHLSKFHMNPAPAPVITEFHEDTELPDWRTGLKDLAVWGSVLYCVYLFISV